MAPGKQIRRQVNQTIIDALRSKTVPWRSEHGFPRNIWSRKRFGGLNAILLLIAERRRKFSSSLWGTRAQWEAVGGTIEDQAGTEIVLPKGYTVYNQSQANGNFLVL